MCANFESPAKLLELEGCGVAFRRNLVLILLEYQKPARWKMQILRLPYFCASHPAPASDVAYVSCLIYAVGKFIQPEMIIYAFRWAIHPGTRKRVYTYASLCFTFFQQKSCWNVTNWSIQEVCQVSCMKQEDSEAAKAIFCWCYLTWWKTV